MFPTLLQIGPVTITSLGVMAVLGFFTGTFFIWQKGKEENFDEETLMDGILLTAIFALLGGRLSYILLKWNQLNPSLYTFFDLVGQPGFWWFGALTAAIINAKLFCLKHKWDFFKTADFSSFGIAFGILFIDLGVFLDNDFWAIWEFLLMIAVIKLLYYFDKHYRTYEWYKNKRGEALPGFLFLSLLTFFSLSKFIVAFFKEHDLYWIWLQGFNLLVIFAGLGMIYLRSGSLPKIKFIKLTNLKKRKKKKIYHFKSGVDAK